MISTVRQEYIEWRYQKIKRRIFHFWCSKLYRDTKRDTKRSIMIAGTARSGTTWVADLIASQIPCRVLFEPFHSKLVKPYQQFNYFQYMRPNEKNEELRTYSHRVFTGDIRHKWIDREVERIYFQYRIIKEIRANLFLKWLNIAFPDVPILFIIRHPCAVVLSRMQLDWWTDIDINSFLSQPKLINDFLYDRMKIIRHARTDEEKHAVIWCISNLVPLRQFQPYNLNVIFYENLCTKPEQEIPKIFRLIGQDYEDTIFTLAKRASITATHTSAIVTGRDRLSQWKSTLTSAQIKNILSIVDAFELRHIYDDSTFPLVTTL